MYPIIGIDISYHQGEFNWQKAKEQGVTFAFIRACYGIAKDIQFKRNWEEAKKVGIYRSAYGWVIDKMNQINNAALQWDLIKNDPGELPPTVDFESFGTSKPGFSALNLYITSLEAKCGRKPIMYTSKGYWMQFREHKEQYWIKDYPFWIAQWNNAQTPSLPMPFETFTFWQWSGDGNLKGYDYGVPKKGTSIDLDRFNGSMEEFMKFIDGAGTPNNPPITTIEQRLTKLETWAKTHGYQP
jgi:lysozyme